MSGVNAEHEAAATAHREAAEAHEKLAAKYTEAGDHDKAAEHEGQAEDHRGMVSAHETGAGRSIEHQNKAKAQQAAKNAARTAQAAEDAKTPGKAKDTAGHARRVAERAQNDQRVEGNIAAHDPSLVPVWRKVKDQWNPRHMGFEERTEKFHEWVAEHPRDVAAIQDKHADKQLKSSLGQWAQKTSRRGPSVARASARDRGLGQWAKQASGEVPF
jgi:hypothetical protein